MIRLAQGGMHAGWGTLSSTIVKVGGGSESTLLVAWIANSPQVILSFCYFAINSECTTMVGAIITYNRDTCANNKNSKRPVGH